MVDGDPFPALDLDADGRHRLAGRREHELAGTLQIAAERRSLRTGRNDQTAQSGTTRNQKHPSTAAIVARPVVLWYSGNLTTRGEVMAAAATPIKVDAKTDQLISHAAHFLGRSKKDVVDVAVREYIENHRSEIQGAVQQALRQLDGSIAGSVALLTGMSRQELDELGGFSESQ
jgi:hypothetical protein